MAIRDEIRRERQAVIKNGTLKDKWDYFEEYYLLRTVAIIAAIGLIAYFIYSTVTRPEAVLNGAFLNILNYDNTASSTATDLGTDFTEHLSIDTSEQEVTFSSDLTLTGNTTTDVQAIQALTAQASAGVLDFIICPLENIINYAYSGWFIDLTTVLSPEQLEAYKPHLLYMDMAVLEQKAEAFDNDINAADIPIPDCTNPNAMEEPVPIFLDITNCEKVTDIYGYEVTNLVFGICINAPNTENISEFVNYIMNE